MIEYWIELTVGRIEERIEELGHSILSQESAISQKYWGKFSQEVSQFCKFCLTNAIISENCHERHLTTHLKALFQNFSSTLRVISIVILSFLLIQIGKDRIQCILSFFKQF